MGSSRSWFGISGISEQLRDFDFIFLMGVSFGSFCGIQKIFGIFGMSTWDLWDLGLGSLGSGQIPIPRHTIPIPFGIGMKLKNRSQSHLGSSKIDPIPSHPKDPIPKIISALRRYYTTCMFSTHGL